MKKITSIAIGSDALYALCDGKIFILRNKEWLDMKVPAIPKEKPVTRKEEKDGEEGEGTGQASIPPDQGSV